MRAIILIILIPITFLWSCKTFQYAPANIIGRYAQVRDDSVKSYIELTFENRNFLLADASGKSRKYYGGANYFCCDTIAYGTWEIDNNHGVISLSTPQLTNTYIDNNVREEINPNADSVYFQISNPIEKQMGKDHKNIFYTFELYSISDDFGEELYGKEYNSNRIVVANPRHAKIQQFSIHVYTRPEYFARNIAIDPVKTIPYKVKDYHSNSFKIDIPSLTYGYITYLRLKDHLLKIASNNELIWDGVEYKRIR